jgi:hypothetical protein
MDKNVCIFLRQTSLANTDDEVFAAIEALCATAPSEDYFTKALSHMGVKAHLNDATGSLTSLMLAIGEIYVSAGEKGAKELSAACDAVITHLRNPNDKMVKDMDTMTRLTMFPILNVLRKQREAYQNERKAKEG